MTDSPPPPAAAESAAAGGRFSVPAALVAALVALPVFWLLDAPLAGWIVGVGLWVGNALGHMYVVRSAEASGNTMFVGAAAAASMFVRIWIAAGVLVAVAVNDRIGSLLDRDPNEVALAALVLFTVLFTLDLGRRLRQQVERQRTFTTPPGALAGSAAATGDTATDA